MSESNNNVPMRITQLEETSTVEDDQFLPVAKAGNGTKKLLTKTFNLSSKYSSVNYVNNCLSEIYIEGGDGTEVIAQLRFTEAEGTRISIKRGNNIVCWYNSATYFSGGLLEVPEYGSSGVRAWVVVKSNLDFDNSGAWDLLPDAYLVTKSPTIEAYFLSEYNDRLINLEKVTPKVIYVNGVNENVLKQFYLIDDTYRLYRIYATSDQFRVGLKRSDDSYVVNGFDVAPEFYSDKIQKFVDPKTREIIGYYVLHYTGSNYYFNETSGCSFNNEAKSLEYNSIIKEYMNREENLVLIGDSLFGYVTKNILESLLMTNSKKRVFNCGFGGCKMAWGTNDGSGAYDKLSFVTVADAIASEDFSALVPSLSLNEAYPYRYCSLREVDFTKPTTIFVDYCNNDISGNVPIGDLWEYTAQENDFVKTTLLGAFNYGLSKILTKYPHIRIVQFTEAWRMKTDKDGNLVPPYLFVNSLNKTSKDYDDAIIENANRLGVSIFDYTKDGGRNWFNKGYYQVDESHYNEKGYAHFAEVLDALDQSFKG